MSKRIVMAIGVLGMAITSRAQEVSNYDHVAASARVSSLLDQKDGPFGESINRQNGTPSFRQADITITGNGPDISIVRTFDVYARASVNWWHVGAFLDWDLELPKVSAVVPANGAGGWNTTGNWTIAGWGGARCTRHGLPGSGNWKYDAVLHVPEGGQQPILIRATANNTPSLVMSVGGGAINSSLVTKAGWQIGCLPQAKNDSGEGFFAVSPDGTKYWFDWMTYAPAERWLGGEFFVTAASLLVTRIEDRHGNWVSYSYQGKTLVSIASSDGRAITLEWMPEQNDYNKPYVTKIRVNAGTSQERVWEYEYALTRRYISVNGIEHAYFSSRWYRSGTLRRVKLPDASAWNFQMEPLMHTCYHLPEDPECSSNYEGTGFPPTSYSGNMTTPSGLKSEYTIMNRYATRTATQQELQTGPVLFDAPFIHVPQIMNKHWAGPGVDDVWTYAYEDEPYGEPVGETRTFAERNPDGSITRSVVNNHWRNPLEGSLLRKEIYQNAAASTPMSVETYTYGEPTAGGYPAKIGSLVAGYLNRGMHEEHRPLRTVQKELGGVVFRNSVEQYDIFARPIKVTKSSTPSP